MESKEDITRRPIKTREHPLSQKFAAALARRDVSPNTISTWGMVFGIAAGLAFAATARYPETARLFWLAGAFFVQLRLLANLFDGMVAIEGGKKSSVGELYNEVPDRVSDAATLIGLGYAAHASAALGFSCACAAILTAYLRAMGASLGNGQDFSGPFAKPQRMFAATLAGLFGTLAPGAWQSLSFCKCNHGFVVPILVVILIGTLLTALRRLRHIAAKLNANPTSNEPGS
jgi:phosphatidylglycerophosphate synthase